MRKPAAEARRTTVLLGAIGMTAGAALWSLALAAQAGDPQPQPQSPQPAADAHNGAPAASKPAKPDPENRVICRTEEVTGSRLGGRQTCHTKRQWDQIQFDSQQIIIDQKPH